MRLENLCAAACVASVAGTASAAVIANPVTASVTLAGNGGSLVYSAGITQQSGIGDIGTFIGQVGTNVAIRGRWTAQLMGGGGTGANGGNVYQVNVQIGSIIKIGPFAQTYTQPVVQAADRIGGDLITGATIGFGVGGGGLRFNDFGGANQILIDNSGAYGDTSYGMKVDPNFEPFGVTGLPALMPSYATVAADGSVGFLTAFNVTSLWAGGGDVSALFNGNLAENQIRGFNSSFYVEVVEVPSPGGLALLVLAGAAAGRRRR